MQKAGNALMCFQVKTGLYLVSKQVVFVVGVGRKPLQPAPFCEFSVVLSLQVSSACKTP